MRKPSLFDSPCVSQLVLTEQNDVPHEAWALAVKNKAVNSSLAFMFNFLPMKYFFWRKIAVRL